MLEAGSKRILVSSAWDIDTFNTGSTLYDIQATDHIVILEETVLTSLDCDWLDQDGAAVTSVTLPVGRYEMRAKSFSCDNDVIIVVA